MFLKNIDNVKEIESNLTFAEWDHLADEYGCDPEMRKHTCWVKHADCVLWVTTYKHIERDVRMYATPEQREEWNNDPENYRVFTLLKVDFDPDDQDFQLSRLLIDESPKNIHIEIGALLEQAFDIALSQ